MSKLQAGFELDLPHHGWSHRIRARAILKLLGELLHRKAGLPDQRPKSPFGKFFVIWNGEASMRGSARRRMM
jgi:hypothetical protein